MSVQSNFVAESIDRVQEAFQSVGDEVGRLQGEMDDRRKKFESDAQKSVKKLRKELRSQPFWKRADSFRRDATKQIEQGIDGLLGTLQIASTSDMKKIDRKLNALGKRLKEIETRAKTKAPAKAAAPKTVDAETV
jgi:hypothetical protein